MSNFIYGVYEKRSTAEMMVAMFADGLPGVPSAGWTTKEYAFEDAPNGGTLLCVEYDDNAELSTEYQSTEKFVVYKSTKDIKNVYIIEEQ
jgi:hypothetical protein